MWLPAYLDRDGQDSEQHWQKVHEQVLEAQAKRLHGRKLVHGHMDTSWCMG